MEENNSVLDPIILGEVQLLLSEKRTSLSVLRTGISVLVLPLSVLSILIATEKYYDVFNVLHFMVPLLLLNIALIVLGAYLVIRSVKRLRHFDQLIHKIKLKHSVIGEFLD